jgi:hypothetical protein
MLRTTYYYIHSPITTQQAQVYSKKDRMRESGVVHGLYFKHFWWRTNVWWVFLAAKNYSTFDDFFYSR